MHAVFDPQLSMETLYQSSGNVETQAFSASPGFASCKPGKQFLFHLIANTGTVIFDRDPEIAHIIPFDIFNFQANDQWLQRIRVLDRIAQEVGKEFPMISLAGT